jgi:hypothetical protein
MEGCGMTTYARMIVQGGRWTVTELVDEPTPTHLDMIVVAVPDDVPVQPGWVYDQGAGTFSAPTSAPAMWITKSPAEFVNLFSFAEEAAIAASVDPVVQVFYRRVYMPTLQQVERAKVTAGIGYLVSVELLTQARADAILAGEEPS